MAKVALNRQKRGKNFPKSVFQIRSLKFMEKVYGLSKGKGGEFVTRKGGERGMKECKKKKLNTDGLTKMRKMSKGGKGVKHTGEKNK